jgi:hypothetical protein
MSSITIPQSLTTTSLRKTENAVDKDSDAFYDYFQLITYKKNWPKKTRGNDHSKGMHEVRICRYTSFTARIATPSLIFFQKPSTQPKNPSAPNAKR